MIHSGIYEQCVVNWMSITPPRQNALLLEMKKFIDEQVAAGSDNEFPAIYQTDAMGEDISDVPGLFRSL